MILLLQMEISVVIIAFNEEDRLANALKSVEDIAAEIIVVDSYSQDNTVELAKQFTNKVFRHKWTNYSDQKNFANSKASCFVPGKMDTSFRVVSGQETPPFSQRESLMGRGVCA